MNEKIGVALFRYMAAHINLNSRAQLKSMSEVEVADMFSTLPPPAINFEEWCEIVKADVDEEIKPKTSEEVNEDFIEQMKLDPNVKVEEHEE